MGSMPVFKRAVVNIVSQSGVPVFSVDYRLAPEHQDLTLVEDCYAGLIWLAEQAQEFNVDLKWIAVMGESAGGGITAGAVLMARGRGFFPPLAKQFLVYPMLDDRNTKPVAALELSHLHSGVTTTTSPAGRLCSETKQGKDGVSPYAAPARVDTVEGLPPTYTDLGELDIFRDEDISYALLVAAANISIELHVYPGVPHAFETVASEVAMSRQALAKRTRARTTF